MASSAGISPAVSHSSSVDSEKMLSFEDHEARKITTTEVYELGKGIAQEMQRVTADYGKGCLEGLVEKVLRTLEWLEYCAVQNEELQKTKCQLLLKEDELLREREKTKKLQLELKGMTLVVEERGRQRDILAGRLSDLEIQNKNYQEMLNAYEQAQAHKQRSKRYSTIDENPQSSMNLHSSRTKSLDRREMKPFRGNKSKEKDIFIEQLQKELMQEKRRVTEMRESSTLDQRRVQQRLKHMEQDCVTLTKQLSIAQIHIERLKGEKRALLERSEVIKEVKAVQLATVARQMSGDGGSEENGSSPKFFKKDLLMILKDRNEQKEKIAVLEEELAAAKKHLKSRESVKGKKSKEHSPHSKRASSSYCSAPCIQEVWERNEGSMVILDVPNYYLQHGKSKSQSSSNHSGSDHSLHYSIPTSSGKLNGHNGTTGDTDDSTSL